MREFLLDANREQGVTILLTTHDMDDIENLCRRVMIIDHGRLLYDGALDQIRERYGRNRTLVIDLQEVRPAAEVEAAVEGIGVGYWVLGVGSDKSEHLTPNTQHPTPVPLLRSERQRHWIRFDRGVVSAAELIAAVSARLPVMDLAIEEPEIEGIIARIYREGMGSDE